MFKHIIIALLLFTISCTQTFETQESAQTNSKDGVFVLCYHSFTNFPHEITFPIKQLILHIETLQNGGFNFITTEDLYAGRYKGLNNVLITSDDGNKSIYKAYFEVFKKYNIKPLIAIFPAIIGKRDYALTWEQIAELRKEGCHIAAHGYFHVFLDAKAYRADPHSCKREVTESKKLLESKLKFNINTFVYPYGKRCNEVVKLVEETGYSFGFTVENGIVYRDDPNLNLLEMPRYMIINSNVNQIFELMFEATGKTYTPNPALRAFSGKK